MAKLILSGPTRESDAELARATAVSSGIPVHVHIIPAEESIVVTTGDDVFVPPSSRIITTEAFRDRFTPAELLAIVASTDAQIKYALLKLSTKEQPLIDLDKAEVIATMDRLVTLSLITAARKTAILA